MTPISPSREVAPPGSRAAAAYQNYYSLLEYVATRKFRVPPEDARGVIHDVFVSFIRSDSKIGRSPKDERSWLVGATCNASRYYWRKQRADEVPADLLEPIDPVALAESAIARVVVARVLHGLDARCRDVLRGRYAEGKTPEEIARAQTLKYGSAKNLITKCLEAARVALHRLNAGSKS
jgi:RNA polymerase sigma factor (sigma-70 family)